MAAPSLFCEHKKLRSTCMVCGASRVGPPPAKGPVKHDVDATWHALRLECAQRLRAFLELGRKERAWSPEAYWRVYDKPPRAAPRHSEEEDPSTYKGAFYLAYVKMFDLTIDSRRIQGYNGLADWDDCRDYLFRAHPPEALAKLVAEKRLLIHGGNGAFSRQQIASEIIRSPRLKEAVELLAFGKDGTTPAREATDADIVSRLAAVEAMKVDEVGGSLPFATRILHVMAPERWPALGARTAPEVGERLEVEIPAVATPADYVPFAQAMRAFAKRKGHADLAWTDIVFNNAYEEMQAEEGDDEELPPLDE